MPALSHRPLPLALGALSLAGASLPVQAGEQAPPAPLSLAPASPWNIDYGESDCLMQRAFEVDGKRHLVTIQQDAPGRNFGLTVAGPEVKRLLEAKALTLELSDRGPMAAGQQTLSAELPDYGPALIFSGVTLEGVPAQGPQRAPGPRSAGIDPAEAAKADRIVLSPGKGKPGIRFETGKLKSVFAAMNTCTDDLLARWGLDPVQHRSYTPPVFRNAMELATQLNRNYPARAAANAESGIFSFRVIVEADGSISSCHIEARSKVQDLDPRCKDILRIAKFDPARDAEGQPMRSFYATTLTYMTG